MPSPSRSPSQPAYGDASLPWHGAAGKLAVAMLNRICCHAVGAREVTQRMVDHPSRPRMPEMFALKCWMCKLWTLAIALR